MSRWGFVSDTLIQAYNKKSLSAPITAPISFVSTFENVRAFVDDTHGLIIRNHDNPATLQDLLQHNMQPCENFLHTVGGKLEITKSKFVRFNYTGVTPPATTNETPDNPQPAEITILDHETTRELEMSEIQHNKLLGVYIALDGNTTAQLQHFSQKCHKLAIAFAKCHLSPADTLQGYRSIFLLGAKYGLAAINIASKDLQTAENKISQIILPKRDTIDTLRHQSYGYDHRTRSRTHHIPTRKPSSKLVHCQINIYTNRILYDDLWHHHKPPNRPSHLSTCRCAMAHNTNAVPTTKPHNDHHTITMPS
jgi:hypothetical protein